MEGFLEALGIVGLVVLVVIGLLAGYIASLAAGGRDRGRYMVIGVLAALATPFLLALVGVTVLAASGLVAILIAAILGAALVLVVAELLTRDRSRR